MCATQRAKSAGQLKNTSATMLLGALQRSSPVVMGILNVTPDSFSDGGSFVDVDAAKRHAESMLEDGAGVIDIGGESTRPGANPISVTEELHRVIPVLEAVRDVTDTPLSIDTSKPEVMREAVAQGAALINDVRALQQPGALATAAELAVPVCLMHMQGSPKSMQDDPKYTDISTEVASFLQQRMAECVSAGIPLQRIVLDPGFGFGKTHAQNLELLSRIGQLQSLGRPILVGLSRKSTLGEVTGRDVDERIPAGVAAAVIAVLNGASIVRTHDVKETYDALRLTHAVMEAG